MSNLQTTDLKKEFKKESKSFDLIAKERSRNHQIPDMRVKFSNPYFYNNIWRNSVFLKEEYGPIRDWLVSCLKDAGVNSVIELGCGNGWLALELARAGFNTTGFDISLESIRVAQAYLKKINKKEKLSLKYTCKNIIDYKGYQGESVISFGFLHHLPSKVLKEVMRHLSANMKKGNVFLAAEPRYDHASFEMAVLIYALRLALPNYFRYQPSTIKKVKHILGIFSELSESGKPQSVMDKESSSELIIKVIRNCFGNIKLTYCTSFFDKIIGSMRVDNGDLAILSSILKQLDNTIVKYRPDFSRTVMISAEKR